LKIKKIENFETKKFRILKKVNFEKKKKLKILKKEVENFEKRS